VAESGSSTIHALISVIRFFVDCARSDIMRLE
jgi:hypothetical protein